MKSIILLTKKIVNRKNADPGINKLIALEGALKLKEISYIHAEGLLSEIYTDFYESYNKKAAKFLKKHPDLISIYKKALQLLELNPQHPSLRLHRLQGNLQDLHSISINIRYQITFEFIIRDKNILLVNVGDLDSVY